MNLLELIAGQQKGKEYTDAWAVGEQLKEILRADPSLEELVSKDMEDKTMSITECAKKIKAWADNHHKKGNNCVFVPPQVAEEIIREFYGLPGRGAEPQLQLVPKEKPAEAAVLDLSDFL